MSDSEIATRLATIRAQVDAITLPTLAEVETHLAANPLPENGWLHSYEDDRLTTALRMSDARNAERERLGMELGKLEYVQEYRLLEGGFNLVVGEPDDAEPTAVAR
jgi:hypothetical protein